MKTNKTNDEKKLEKEADEYQKIGFFQKIPYWIKAIFIKYWFFGAICFFVLMGFGTLGVNGLVAVLICALLGGALTDIAADNILIMIESDKNESKWFMIYKSKKVLSMIINILYTFVIFEISSMLMSLIISTYEDKSIWFLQEPLSQALVLIIVDMAFIGIKDLILYELMKHNCIKPKDKNKN